MFLLLFVAFWFIIRGVSLTLCCFLVHSTRRFVLSQGYRYHKLRKAFSKFHRRHFDLVSKFSVGLKSLLQQGLSEPEFYGDLVYKFRKIYVAMTSVPNFVKSFFDIKRLGTT